MCYFMRHRPTCHPLQAADGTKLRAMLITVFFRGCITWKPGGWSCVFKARVAGLLLVDLPQRCTASRHMTLA